MRNTSKDVFDSVNTLVDHDFAKRLFSMISGLWRGIFQQVFLIILLSLKTSLPILHASVVKRFTEKHDWYHQDT